MANGHVPKNPEKGLKSAQFQSVSIYENTYLSMAMANVMKIDKEYVMLWNGYTSVGQMLT